MGHMETGQDTSEVFGFESGTTLQRALLWRLETLLNRYYDVTKPFYYVTSLNRYYDDSNPLFLLVRHYSLYYDVTDPSTMTSLTPLL